VSRQLSLFSPVGAATPTPETLRLAESVPQHLYFGTSSWSFPGWDGIVYDRRISQTALARHGLAAYAQHPLLRTVCIDRSYYGPPTATEFADYAASVPEHFRFVVKAHEYLTRVRTKDGLARNEFFLDAAYAEDEVIGPCLEGLGEAAAVLVLQFPPQRVDAVDRFAIQLREFLERLPKQLLYAVELRNPELLSPSYRETLRDTGACHCYNVHPTMPSLEEQAGALPPAEQPAVIVRWMLRRNRSYADAKDAFHPFNKLAEPDPGSRQAVAALARDAKRAFIIVNNKAEGCAPLSLVGLAEEITRPRKS
jgi:uncharacterized protein YecE (DUF72 family)